MILIVNSITYGMCYDIREEGEYGVSTGIFRRADRPESN